MCGLVGIAGRLEHKDEMTMKKLLVYDYFRGTDSTGLAVLRNNNQDFAIAKAAVNPLDLFDMTRFKSALTPSSSSVFLGHNRAATKGKVNNNNAHPFQYDHIIGAHNGTLDKSSWDKLMEATGEQTDVDSQAIFIAIAKLGIEETVKLLQGAWALTWIDLQQGTLNFLRNKERPLWYGYTKDFKHLFWASEYKFIDAAVRTSSIIYDWYRSDKGYGFWQFEEDWWYRYDIEQLKKGAGEGNAEPKPKVKKLEGKAPAPVTSMAYGSGYTPFRDYRGTTSTTTSRTSTVLGGTNTSGTPSKSNIPDVIEMSASINEPLGGFITEDEFDEKYGKYNCSWCRNPVDYHDKGIAIYVAQEYVLCTECCNHPATTRIYAPEDMMELYKDAA